MDLKNQFGMIEGINSS